MTSIQGEALRDLFQRLPEAVKLINREGRIQVINPAGLRLLEAGSGEELLGQALVERVPAPQRPAFQDWLARAWAGSADPHEFPLTGLRGTERWLEARAAPLSDAHGEVTGLLVVSRDLTARRRLEEQLRLSRERLLATLHSIGDAVIATDEHGRVEELNPVAERLTGWPAAEARGRPLTEVFPIVNEETRQPVEDPVTRVWREGTVVGLANHTLLLARDGREIPIADAGAPIRDAAGRIRGVVLVFRDQTAERAAQRAVAEARAFAESIVATMREPLLVLDAGLRVVSANRAFYRTFQVTPEETLGRPLHELGNREWDIPELRRLLEDLLPQNTQFQDFEVTHEFERIGRRTLLLNARRLYREGGRPEMILLAFEDITERKRAEEALQEVRERDRNIYELISDYAYTFRVEPDGTLRGEWVNETFVRVFGYTIPEIEARGGWPSMVHPEDLPAMLAHARRVAGGRRDVWETRFVTRSGEVRWIRDHAVPIHDPATGRVVRIHGAAQDITEQKQAEEALRLAEQGYRSLFEANPEPMWVYDLQTLRFLEVNDAAVAAYGYSREEFLGMTIRDIRPESEVPRLLENVRTATEVLQRTGPWIHRKKNGELIQVEISSHAVTWQGRPARMVHAHDVTRREEALAALRVSEERHRLIISLVSDYVFYTRVASDGRLQLEWVAGAFEAITGYTPEEYQTRGGWRATVHPADRAQDEHDLAQLRAGRRVSTDLRTLTKSGEARWVHVDAHPVLDPAGQTLVGIYGAVRDITERKRAEQERDRLAVAIEQAAEAIIITDPAARILYVNPAFERITGYTVGEVLGQNPRLLQSGRHDAAFYARLWATLTAGAVWRGRLINRKKDGTLYEEEKSIAPVRDAAGRLLYYVAVGRDVTRERELEAQLLQAQKLEAIGRLAGGVAHDFNNILAVLLLQAELLGRVPNLPDQVREGLEQMRHATERAASLTRQLLLFSRKQALQPRHLDLNQVVNGMARMLRRLIGEDIHFELQTAAEPLPLHADPGMIEQVLLNLVVNARDAMPRGGRLRVRTGAEEVDEDTARRHPEARPGRYVWLRVEDTGCGIPPEVLPHIFEPFFTTKEAGKGTGLGLATVYSVARQHQGWVTVDTEVGRGSTFLVYLPAASRAAAAGATGGSGPGGSAPGGTETILLVEDDPTLRESTRAVLAARGYEVLVAEDALHALQLWVTHGSRVALVLTDLVMPGGIGGQELARLLLWERPGLKVVYTSGYSEEWSGAELRLGPGERFVPKPCPPEQLLEILRQCLDA